ncbi:TPA: hypothetical protein ACNMQV_002075 [Klebsiella pneumoniae]|uniref:hypothetical protein n=1 Tax=Klebsiella TaxID=570 RepID=UPI000DE799D2|nr:MULTISPECIES: hypothetical protein [Klebsiella]MCQ8842387.1 hypothetical protein [Klebsiella sp. KJ_S1]MCS5937886.1 hypothetical protein [Klebsiella variicola subsp. variicola]HBT3202872.1 hypothetical protein [Klebsiella aerogenes]HCB0453025.1 hypothetical protein [Klebsiella quasipneumoniae subsp. quasipneumoniae]HCI6117301.1 hypothetical protein [Klebsiella quasipneumoniae subsp. similipneumoniae]HEJ8152773.1 hypothetical protein [Klebsiella oxytoca]
MNISFPDETYRTLLKEANRRDMPMAKLCSELLQTAAKIIEKCKTDNQRGYNDNRDSRN